MTNFTDEAILISCRHSPNEITAAYYSLGEHDFEIPPRYAEKLAELFGIPVTRIPPASLIIMG